MKRLFSFLCAVLLIGCFLCPAFAEDGPEVFSYQFDLHFHLDATAFPGPDQAHLQGYAELLDSLEIRGTVTWCPETDSMDLNAELVPVTNPSAAIPFRLYGIPDYLCFSSPLLNGETVFIHNYAFMEFSEKAWRDFSIPLQLLALMDPYQTIGAFAPLQEAWNKEFGATKKSRAYSASGLKSVAKSWDSLLEDNYRLTHWITAVSSLLEDSTILETDFADLPAYLTDRVAGGKKLTVTVKNGTTTVTDSRDNYLWVQSAAEGSRSLSVTLPETKSGYLPSLSYSLTEDETSFSFDFSADYSLAPAEVPDGDEEESNEEEGGAETYAQFLPDTLLSVNLSLVSVPLNWPAETEFTGSAVIKGQLLPNLDCTFRAHTSDDGSFLFSAYPAGQQESPALTCSGSFVPVAAESVPRFTHDELVQHFNVFSVNDQSLYDFVHRIARPMVLGLLDFLYELPPRACQSVMDDLEDSGILDMIMK